MNFNQQAQQQLNAMVPGVSKYVIAFKDMSEDAPSGKDVQVGVFILKNSDGRFFIPVISKNNTILPMDSIYSEENRTFMPLTNKTADQLRTSVNMGVSKKIPRQAVNNPDVKDLVVPPRTGKFMYASDGQLEGVIVQADPVIRDVVADALEKMAQEDLLNDYDVDTLLSQLRDHETLDIQKSAGVTVIVDGEGLSDSAIQDILAKGYHIDGEHRTTRIAVESGGGATLTELSAAQEGMAYVAVTRDNRSVPIAVLPWAQDLSSSGHHAHKMLLDMEGGYQLRKDSIVIKSQEADYAGILESVETYPATLLYELEDALINDGTGYFPFHRNEPAEIINGVTTVRGYLQAVSGAEFKVSITICEAMKGMVIKNTSGEHWHIMLNAEARVIPIRPSEYNLEKSMSAAVMRQQAQDVQLLPEYHTLAHHNGEFSVDGRMVGDLPSTMKVLVTKMTLQPSDAETFVKSAQVKGKIGIHMSKEAAESNHLSEIPSYGQQLPAEAPITGRREDRALGTAERLRAAAKVKDREVMETSIMAELLNDPSMRDTIRDYLPNIRGTVDRLGRTLFLIRMASDKLEDQMDQESMGTMISNLKSSYSNLGETLIKLERMTSNV